MALKLLIVDDEPLALDILETYAEDIPSVELVARTSNPMEALEILKSTEIDLACLDIQMPELTGIELVRSLKKPPHIVFTTAYSEYAIEGYELDIVDYLLKPISKERFLRAIHKTEEIIQRASMPDDETVDFMFVKADKKLIKVLYDDIIYIEGLKDYVQIRMDSGRIVTLQTMKSLEEKLPSNIFERVHRSFIVNVNKVNALDGNALEVTEKGNVKHLPIGKNYRERIFQLINKNRL